MAAGDRIITSAITPGLLIPQPGASFPEADYGIDTGERTFETHPLTPRTAWPKRGDRDIVYPTMFVTDVRPRDTESGMIELAVSFKGLVRGSKGHKLVPGCDVQGLSVSALGLTYIVQVPVPTLTRSYVTLTQPDYTGVGAAATDSWLPTAPDWTLSGIISTTVNYITGWVLQGREWDPDADKVWEVRERYAYFYTISG